MYTSSTTISNTTGLHARPATLFVEEAQKYSSKIFIKNLTSDSKAKNAKSIISLLSLAMTSGTEIEISAEGEDETEAVDNLIKLVDSGLEEG